MLLSLFSLYILLIYGITWLEYCMSLLGPTCRWVTSWTVFSILLIFWGIWYYSKLSKYQTLISCHWTIEWKGRGLWSVCYLFIYFILPKVTWLFYTWSWDFFYINTVKWKKLRSIWRELFHWPFRPHPTVMSECTDHTPSTLLYHCSTVKALTTGGQYKQEIQRC